MTYRDKIYIVKDVILKLVESGQLTQTNLISFCGLNLTKHRWIIDEMEQNCLVERTSEVNGKKTISLYRPTTKGIRFCYDILEEYEKMFPRDRIRNAKSE
jgi:predicted transcriptional regulator